MVIHKGLRGNGSFQHYDRSAHRKNATVRNRYEDGNMSQNDMQMAEETYGGFVAFIKWGTLAAVATAALVILLIS